MLIKNLDSVTGELYCRDIAVSSMVSGQKNFMKLVGCCLEFENPIMVFDYVKKHYKLDLREQPWKRRMKIAEDISTVLAYLHTAFARPFIYRTLSFDDILLDKDGVAKLRDFSYCVSIPEGETFVDVRVVGHFLYMDPKYAMRGVVSEKTDVFAIGRFMQNLLLGNERFEKFIRDDGVCDGDGGVTMKEPRVDEIADPEMLRKMGEISEQELCQMKAFLTLSQRCIVFEVDHKEFPTMVEVAKELKKIVRSFRKYHSSSPLGKTETQFDSTQDISSSVVL